MVVTTPWPASSTWRLLGDAVGDVGRNAAERGFQRVGSTCDLRPRTKVALARLSLQR